MQPIIFAVDSIAQMVERTRSVARYRIAPWSSFLVTELTVRCPHIKTMWYPLIQRRNGGEKLPEDHIRQIASRSINVAIPILVTVAWAYLAFELWNIHFAGIRLMVLGTLPVTMYAAFALWLLLHYSVRYGKAPFVAAMLGIVLSLTILVCLPHGLSPWLHIIVFIISTVTLSIYGLPLVVMLVSYRRHRNR